VFQRLGVLSPGLLYVCRHFVFDVLFKHQNTKVLRIGLLVSYCNNDNAMEDIKMEHELTYVRNLTLDELQKTAGGDLYDDLLENDDIVSNMKRFALIAKRLGKPFEEAFRLTIYGWGDEVPHEEIEAFVRSIY
jgi:hypothetical protein